MKRSLMIAEKCTHTKTQKIHSSKMAKYRRVSLAEWYVRNALRNGQCDDDDDIDVWCFVCLNEISIFQKAHFCSHNVNHNENTSFTFVSTDITVFICIFARNADIPRGYYINRILIKCGENEFNVQSFKHL